LIQDIFPQRFDNHYLVDREIGDDDYVFHYKEDTFLLKIKDNEFELPKKKDFPEISNTTACTFLFTLDDVPCFLVWDDLKVEDPRFVFTKTHFYRTTKQHDIAWVCIVGLHLRNWYVQSQFCGKCGSKNRHKSDERAMICPVCNTVVYPRISPAVIVAIVCKNKILLARNNNFPGNWYSLVSGYVDVGETLEEALIREVKEEVGLEVNNIRYYKNQPWALSGTMMVGFVAEADENQPIVLEDKELAAAAWFERGNLPEHSLNLSIAGEMIEAFEKGLL
jgi:NAD+ diphosphatase